MALDDIEPKSDIGDVGVMLNTGNDGKIHVTFISPRVSSEDALDLYYDGKLDADGRQTKYGEIEAKLKKLGWSPLKIHVESYQGSKMTLDKLPLKLSEETQYRLARMLYCEEENSGGNGGLASAADLGPLPHTVLGGAGIGFETRRRRSRMQSEESYDVAEEFLDAVCNYMGINEDDAEEDDGEPEAETADEALENAVRKINAAHDGVKRGYMVSWADPRIVGKLHKDQQRLGNGVFYVAFGSDKEASDFYKDLNNQGVYNVKIDAIG